MENFKVFNYSNIYGKCQIKEWIVWDKNTLTNLWNISICFDKPTVKLIYLRIILIILILIE
jgi:hypothetical protein